MAIRTVVVGMGPRGRDWILEIQQNKEFKLVGCVEVDKQVLQDATRTSRLNGSPTFTNLSQALEGNDIQAVIVATPPEAHLEPCRIALTKKIGVMVEKPFTTTLSDAITLVRLGAENSTPLLVAQNYRYLRAFRAARDLVTRGVLGPVGLAVCQYYRIPHEMSASLASMPHSVLWGMGVHHLDMIRYVVNKPVVGVFADSFTLPWGALPSGASTRLLLTLQDDVRVFYGATYESSGHEYFERGQEFYARFMGQRATLHIFHRWLLLCESGKLPRIIRRGPRRVSEEQLLLTQLARAVLDGAQPESSGLDNLQTMAVVEATIRSARERKWINPQELLDELQQS